MRSAGFRWRGLALGGAFPAVLHMATTLGYDSSYSHQLYAREAFLGQYGHGIYRYRVLGRELVLYVGQLLEDLKLTLHTPATDIGHGRPPGDLFTAFVLVNGVALVALAALLYKTTDRGDSTPYLVLIVLVAMSGYVVTPYDNLGYLLMVAAVVVALRRWRLSWIACLPLAVAGTATRESFFVGVAAVVAALIAGLGGWHALVRWRDPLWRAAAALVVGSVGTYFALRVVLADPHEPHTLWMRMPRSLNWNMGSVIALVLLMLGVWILQVTAPRPAGGGQRWWRRTRVLLWVASLPYLAVSFRGGLWFEGLRLVMPVLLCEYVLRSFAPTGEGAGRSVPAATGVTVP